MVKASDDFFLEYVGRTQGPPEQPGVNLKPGDRFALTDEPLTLCRHPFRDRVRPSLARVLLMDDATISAAQHCQIWKGPEDVVMLQDLGSSTGTFLSIQPELSGKSAIRVRRGRTVPVVPGMHVFAARCCFRVVEKKR